MFLGEDRLRHSSWMMHLAEAAEFLLPIMGRRGQLGQYERSFEGGQGRKMIGGMWGISRFA